MRILIYVHDPCHPENQIASRAVVTLADWVRAERVPSHCRPIPLRTEAASGRCYSFKMKGQTFDYLTSAAQQLNYAASRSFPSAHTANFYGSRSTI